MFTHNLPASVSGYIIYCGMAIEALAIPTPGCCETAISDLII
jgi:hypothetical protein